MMRVETKTILLWEIWIVVFDSIKNHNSYVGVFFWIQYDSIWCIDFFGLRIKDDDIKNQNNPIVI